MTAPNLTDLVATTARRYIDKIQDNVTNDNGLLSYLKGKGMIERYSGGGRTVVEPFIWGTNSSVQWYDGYDTFTPPTTQEVFDGAEYQWKQLGGFISISGKEKRMNRGKEEQFSFAKVRLKQIQAQLKNVLGTAMYAVGTGSGGKELGGLQLLVADDPTAAGTVGGINQVTNAFWRNKYSAAAATSASTIRGRMNSMWLAIKRGADVPDLWVGDDDMYGYYWEALQGLMMITTAEAADAGYGKLFFKGSTFIYDDQCPNKHLYAINSEEIKLRTIDDRLFDVGDARKVTNADYEVIPVYLMGTLTTGRRAGHGVVIAS